MVQYNGLCVIANRFVVLVLQISFSFCKSRPRSANLVLVLQISSSFCKSRSRSTNLVLVLQISSPFCKSRPRSANIVPVLQISFSFCKVFVFCKSPSFAHVFKNHLRIAVENSPQTSRTNININNSRPGPRVRTNICRVDTDLVLVTNLRMKISSNNFFTSSGR